MIRKSCTWGFTLLVIIATWFVLPLPHDGYIASESGPLWHVRVVKSPVFRSIGLMGRESLGDRQGMLFEYDQNQPVARGFWMYQTRIPLDIAFLSADGEVLSTTTMPPCPESKGSACPSYHSSTPYRYALEVNAGALESASINQGDILNLPRYLASP